MLKLDAEKETLKQRQFKSGVIQFAWLSMLFMISQWIIYQPLAVAQETNEVAQEGTVLLDSTLLYVSDYISFIGEDDQGHVALALDTNRGRDGESYQAEHFVVDRLPLF